MKRDHLEFLCDVGELGSVLAGSSDIETFLQRLVRLVADHLQAHVCSIYFYEDATRELALRATVGLHLDSAKQIRLKEGEGLVGTTLQKQQPMLDNRASRNPRYKYFPGIGEEPYDSFLAVPIVRDVERIGVLAVQREARNPFHEDDVTAMRAVACQLAGCIENARVLMGLAAPQQPQRRLPTRRRCS